MQLTRLATACACPHICTMQVMRDKQNVLMQVKNLLTEKMQGQAQAG